MIRRHSQFDNYTIIPHQAEKDLISKPRALALLLHLMCKPRTWKVSYSGLAATTGWNKDTVGKALKELKAAGYAKHVLVKNDQERIVGHDWLVSDTPIVEGQEGGSSDGGSSSEDAETDEPETGFPDSGKACQKPETGFSGNGKRINIVNNDCSKYLSKTKNTPLPPNPDPEPDSPLDHSFGATVCPEGFEQFWNEYPNKKGKAAAERTWKRKKLGKYLEQILKHIRYMRTTADWSSEKYIPYGSTYVNQERWKDGVPVKQASNSSWKSFL